MLISVRLHKVLHSYWLDLHDVSDVKIQYPFILVQETQNCSHIDLVSFFFIDCAGLLWRCLLVLIFDLEIKVLDVIKE